MGKWYFGLFFDGRMEANDRSIGIDFTRTCAEVDVHSRMQCTLEDGRKWEIHFRAEGDATAFTEHFEADENAPEEMQPAGWQAILNNFKAYAEGKTS
jgi:uncharacterized protein YndB with AHSA1/START domain